MAIRKFRKKMKLITIVITLAFLVSSVALYIMTQMSYTSTKNYAFKLNGEKVALESIARTKYMLSRDIKEQVDESIYETLAVDQTIDEELTQQLADELKIKVSGKDIDAEYDKLAANFEDKEQFKRMISAQGFTKASLKKEIGKNLKKIKVMESFITNVNVTDEEILKVYEDNKYSMFKGETFENIKEKIREALIQRKGNENFIKALEEKKANMKISDVREQISPYMEKEKLTKDGITFTNVDYNEIYLQVIQNGVSLEEADKQAESFLETQTKIFSLATKYGIEIPKNLPNTYKANVLYEKVMENLKNNVKYTEENLKKFFNENRAIYDTQASADSYIAEYKLEPSILDKAEARKSAENILKGLTKENFATVAKNKSECPSAQNGGDLGKFKKNMMVPEFSEAVFKGKVGEIYPEIVETVYGAHIIYVAEKNEDEEIAKASHILIKYKVSDETIKEAEKDIENTLATLTKGDVKFEELPKDRYVINSLYSGITTTGYIPDLTFDKTLSDEIYKMPIGKAGSIKIGEKIYLFKKVKEIKYKEAKFEDVKENVTKDYITIKASEELKQALK